MSSRSEAKLAKTFQIAKRAYHSYEEAVIARSSPRAEQQKREAIKMLSKLIDELNTSDFGLHIIAVKTVK